MTPHSCRTIGAALLAALVVALPARSQPQLPPPAKLEVAPAPTELSEPGVRVLDKGPIHEAFAQPGADVRGKGITAPKAPPPPIPELPPDTKPDGENVKWIPGYWMWDADRNDFIWISGFYRNTPPGREWSAGEWTKSKDGTFSYAPGFWRPSNMNSWRVDLPEPPKTVENGPNTPPNRPDGVWIPGNWEFRNGQYLWRPGYWAYPNGDMVWQPGQYLASGSGYSYAPGYWDYPLEDRGLLYAPVCFTQPLWQNAGWAYRPRFALGLGLGYGGWGYGGLFNSLYIGPGYNSYYYGNYGSPFGYGGSWLGFGSSLWSPVFGYGSPLFGLGGYGGYYPWYATNRGYYNPLWNHYCYLNRNNANFVKNTQTAFVGHAMGVTPTHATVAPASVVTRQGVGGATNAAVRATTTNVTQSRPAPSAPLIQPASQVVKSLNATNVARSVAMPAAVAGTSGGVGNPTVGLRSNMTHPGGVTVTPGAGVITQGNPLHAGASSIRPATATSFTNPGGVQIQPGSVGRPALTTPNFSSTPSAPAFRSMPSIQSAPSFHPSMPSISGGGRAIGGIGGGGGGVRSMGGGGVHMGGGGGGHVGGGGGHGGGHR